MIKEPSQTVSMPVLVGGVVLIGSIAFFASTQLFTISIVPKYPFAAKISAANSALVPTNQTTSAAVGDTTILQEQVTPNEGIALPIQWKDSGKRMTQDGVIDETSFRALFSNGLQNLEEQMLSGKTNDKIVMNTANSRFVLDMLWAFGLSNKNVILEHGEMTDPQYGGAGNFASTGGWSLSKGKAMDHYSKYAYVVLNKDQQALVDKVSRNIYRPCCNNSTHFPDCNHGMAMLGLLELMAANNVNETEMYKVALQVNSYWFPQTYLDLATYFKEQGTTWANVDPKLALSAPYSSATGYQTTRQQIKSLPPVQQSGSSCGS